jgi:hypothetical protein
VAEGSDGFAAGLVSADDAAGAIADGAPIVTLGEPVYYAPIGIAYDRSGADPAALEAALSSALDALRSDGTIAARSVARFGGLDLTQSPDGGTPEVPPPGDPAAFTPNQSIVDVFPSEIDGAALSPVFMNGADLDLLLRPSNPDVSKAYGALTGIGEGTDLGVAALGLGMAPVVVGDASAMLTGAKVGGVASADLATALEPLFTNQFRDERTAQVTLGGRTVRRISSGPYSVGDTALFVYPHSGIAWYVYGSEPLVEDIIRALP